MAEHVIGIDIVARLDAFRAELAKIPDIGGREAKALTAALSREVKAAEKASRELAQQTRRTTQETQTFADAAGSAGSVSGKLGQALGLLSPELGAVAQGLADAADGGEALDEISSALGVSLGSVATVAGAVAAAAGGLYLAYQALTEEERRGQEEAAKLAEAHRDLRDVLADTRSRAIELAVETGRLTAEQAALEQAALATQRALLGATDEPRAEIRRLREEQAGLGAVVGDLADQARESWVPGLRFWGAALDGVTTSTAELEQQVGTQTQIIEDQAAAYRDNREAAQALIRARQEEDTATRGAADATRAHVAALDAATAAKRAYLDQVAEDQRLVVESGLALDALTERVSQLGETEAERIERTFAGLQAELDLRRGVLEAAGADVSRYAKLEVDIEAAKQQQLAALRDRETAARTRDLAQLEEQAQQVGDTYLDLAGNVAGGIAEGLRASADASGRVVADLQEAQVRGEGYLTDAQQDELRKRERLARAAALRSWELYKAAQVAQVTAGAAAAFVAGLDDAPFPANLVIAGANSAAAMAQLPAIAAAAPTFHQGGVFQPDEGMALLRRGEPVLTPLARSVAGDEQLQRLSAGVPLDRGPVEAYVRWDHRVLTRPMADTLRRGGATRRTVGSLAALRSGIPGHG